MNAGKPTVIVIIAVVAGVLVCNQSTAVPGPAQAPAQTKAKLGEPAPDFALKDVYGKEFKLSAFKDKIVVLEWINKGCPISRGCHDKGVMQNTYKKYAGKGVIWLAIDTTSGAKPEENRVYAAEQGLAYPVLHDPDGKVGRAYDARTTPHMFVIDQAQKLVYDGAIDDQDKTNYVAAALDHVLADKPVEKPRTEPYGCTVKYASPKGK